MKQFYGISDNIPIPTFKTIFGLQYTFCFFCKCWKCY